jgi:dihydroflavonol-4-reductase
VRYLVTGATGFIGSRLAARLAAEGHEVRAIVRTPHSPAADVLRAGGVHVCAGDLRDRATLAAPMRDVDGVFHLAAARLSAERGADHVRMVNVDGTRYVLEAMRAYGVPRGVLTSALAVNGDTRGRLVDEFHCYDGPLAGVFERAKRDAYRAVAEPMMAEGLPLVVLLPGVVYGPDDRSALRDAFRQYLVGELPMLPRNTAYCWAHVDDVVDVHLRAMQQGHPGESYIVGGPAHTVVEAFEMAARITGVPAPALRVAPGVLRLAAAMMGVVDDEPPAAPRWGRGGRTITSGMSQIGNDAKARRELGFDPRPLAEGLRDTLAHEMRALGMRLPL